MRQQPGLTARSRTESHFTKLVCMRIHVAHFQVPNPSSLIFVCPPPPPSPRKINERSSCASVSCATISYAKIYSKIDGAYQLQSVNTSLIRRPFESNFKVRWTICENETDFIMMIMMIASVIHSKYKSEIQECSYIWFSIRFHPAKCKVQRESLFTNKRDEIRNSFLNCSNEVILLSGTFIAITIMLIIAWKRRCPPSQKRMYNINSDCSTPTQQQFIPPDARHHCAPFNSANHESEVFWSARDCVARARSHQSVSHC